MALKISLKPNEKIFIGGAVVKNGDSPIELMVLNDVSLLREKDIMTEQDADTIGKHIYLCVQLMYMDHSSLRLYQKNYRKLVDEVAMKLPGALQLVAEINNHLAGGNYYQALKCARKMMEYEQELLEHGQQSA